MALVAAVSLGLIAGCKGDNAGTALNASKESGKRATATAPQLVSSTFSNRDSIAGAPDHGTLMAYANAKPQVKGAYTWHDVQLSEAHAMRAVATGTLEIAAPDGTPIRLKTVSHTEHKNGNWTWVGRAEGAKPGHDAIITFGEKAVFASIPNGDKPRLEVTTVGGRTYLIEADASKIADVPARDVDAIPSPTMEDAALVSTIKRAAASAAQRTTAGAQPAAAGVTAANTVDLLLGYSSTFATRLGGDSGANTRLQFMVDTTNDILASSLVDAQIRLVGTMPVDYADTNTNINALFELTGVTCANAPGGQLPDRGVTCSPATRPAALQTLAAARETLGADLVVLVRTFQAPENGSCGVGWLNGNGQRPIDSADAPFGYAVVSDTSGNTFPDPEGGTCRNDNLAHELGHNMGIAHDRDAADRDSDSDGDAIDLDPVEFGAFSYAFGYVASPTEGNFFDTMALRRNGLGAQFIYSNPNVTCGTFPCGNAATADAARALRQTIPAVAQFRANVVPFGNAQRNDFNGDGQSDILWRNTGSAAAQIWLSANSATQQAVTTASLAWNVVGMGDFDGDGSSDILWRNQNSGQNLIWRSGNSATQQAVTTVGNTAWRVAGVGDFDGDGVSDILWRNTSSGANLVWRSASSTTQVTLASVPSQAWAVAGVGDVNGDGRSDIVWRNSQSGANSIWLGGDAATQQAMVSVSLSWAIVGVNDFNGDGNADLLWRNAGNGQNTIWRSGNNTTQQSVALVGNLNWRVASTGDYDGDGVGDILWRNSQSGQNLVWRSGNAATQLPVTPVGNLTWAVQG
ncbi:hypothetical protein LF41_22 [Lysobacter dokdonensis DS-58]|uniref:FG-GAP repeat protein n=1 Tax=Lysobacter dokdonensis DS-58 TaxID=1300345 RepID=A0A0A2WR86_9GAMM|nr:hypothetical protein LF41_22 [Lysobacter dokdonensis DS-58]